MLGAGYSNVIHCEVGRAVRHFRIPSVQHGYAACERSKEGATLKPIRWGLLSTSRIAGSFAADLRLTEGAELAAVGSRSIDSARRFADEYGVRKAHGSYEALVGDPDVDVIYVSTPHALHRDNVLLCFEAGKPVLCEKALTLNARDAAELVAAARSKRLFFMEAMWMRCNPNIRAMQELVRSGVIGEVTAAGADFGFVPDKPPDHRLFDPALGASALLDLGVYTTTFIWLFLGRPSSVQSAGQLSDRGIDLSCASVLSYGNATATSACTMTAFTSRTAYVGGTRGHIDVPAFFNKPREFSVTVDGHTERHAVPVRGIGYVDEIEEVHRCLRRGAAESELVPLDETVAILQVLDQMRHQVGSTLPGDEGWTPVR
jgi:predicted dehydrogenase